MATIKNAIDPQLQADLPRLDIVPTSSPTPLTISVVERNNGTRDITVTWSYEQSRIEATHIGLLWNVNPNSAPAAPTVSNNSGSVILPISQTSYTFEGVNPEQYYRLGIVAGKQVESTWSTTAVVSPTTSPNWQVSKGTSNNTNNINGVLASEITAAMVNFNTSNDQNSNAISAPTGLALTQTLNSVGSVDLTLSWNWSGNEFDIDGFGIYVHADSTSTPYTLGNPSDTVYPTLPSLRSFTAFGVAQNQYYTIGVRAYRVVNTNVNASGFILSSITQLAAVRPNATPNITASVGGQTSTAIANTVTGLSDLNNNGKLTPNEKQELLRKFNEILQYKPGLISQANSLSITIELSTYTAKFQALADFLNNGSTWTSGDPFLLNSTNILVTSDVTGITLDTKILEYINAFEALNQKIASVAATKAVYGNVTGTPTTLAAINSTEGTKLAGIQDEATKGSPAGTLINGVLAETVQSYASNSFTGTTKYRTTGGPTNNPTPTSSTVTANTVGGKDIRLDWSAYVQGTNQADLLYLFFKEGSGTPTIADASIAFNVNTSSGSYYIFQNVDATKAYTAGIAAGRRTENGIEFGSIVTHASWAISAGTANNAATSVGGQTAANVASTVTDTSTFRTSGSPSNQPVLSAAIVSAITAGGTVDIRLPFTYVQGSLPADEFICYFVEGTSAPTTANAVAGKVSKNDREFFFQGVPADKNYRAGIVASRNTSSGPVSGSIVTGWSYTAQTITLDAGKLAGVTASVINSNITNAQNTANTALANAANAQNSATSVNALVADMYSDGKLTPEEKINLRRLFNEAVAGKAAIVSQATGFGITTELNTFNTKFQALADYLNNGTSWVSGDPFWLNSTNISITHDVVGVTLDARINEFLLAQTALFQKVSDIASTKANWSNLASRPNDQELLNSAADYSAFFIWDFQNSSDGWQINNSALTQNTDSISFTSGNDTYVVKSGLAIAGNLYDKIRIRLRRVSGNAVWEGRCYYTTAGHSYSELYKKTIVNTNNVANWHILEFDMQNLTDGGNDWVTNTITAIRIDLVHTSGDIWEVDWISVGKIGSATAGAPAGTLINGIAAETVQSYASNSFTGTSKYRATGGPTNTPVPTAATVTDNTVGGRDIKLNWNAYTQGANQADLLYLFFKEGSGTPTLADASIAFNVNTSSASYYIFQNVDASKAYSAGIAAGRRTENGIEFGSIVTHASWAISAGTANNDATSVAGQTASTVVTNAGNGAAAFSGTDILRLTSTPNGIFTIGAATTVANNSNGRDIIVNFTFAEGGSPCTDFIIFYKQGTTAPTASDASVVIPKTATSWRFENVDISKAYTASIIARRVGNAIYLQSLPGSAHWSISAGSAIELRNDQIKIGGKNVLRNSGNFANTAYWETVGGALSVDNTNTYAGKPTLKYVGQNYFNTAVVRIKPNSIYTVSALVYSSIALTGGNGSQLHMQVWRTEDTANVHQDVGITSDTFILANQWKLIYYIFTTPVSAEACFAQLYFFPLGHPSTNITFNVAYVQLEEGNKYSDWTPCPDDLVSTDLSNAPAAILNSNIQVDASGNLVNIGTSNVKVDNSKITIATNGALSGAGGGQVTIGGLGYFGELDATKGANAANLKTGVGVNLLPNTEFIGGNFNPWSQGWNPDGAVISQFGSSKTIHDENWNLIGQDCLTLRQIGRTSGTTYDIAVDIYPFGSDAYTAIAIKPGERLEFYAYFAAHRCKVGLELHYYTSSNVLISGQAIPATSVGIGGTRLADYTQLGVFATAPENAVKAAVFFRKYNTDVGQTDSWVWITRPYLGFAFVNQTEFSPYVPGVRNATEGAPAGTKVGNTPAQTVESNANNAYAQAAAMIDDNILSPGTEKAFFRSGWDSLVAQRTGLLAQASSLSVSTTAFTAAFQNLANFLHGGTWTSGIPTYISDAQLGTQTSLNGASGRSLLAAMNAAQTDLQNALDAKAATVSTWTGTTGIPEASIYNVDDATALKLNPTFSDWTGTLPAAYGIWSGGNPTKETSLVRVGKNSVRYSVNSGDVGLYTSQAITLGPNAVISGSIDIYLVSRTSGLPTFSCLAVKNAAGIFWFFQVSPETTTGSWQRINFVGRGNGVDTTDQLNFYLMASWGSNGRPFVGDVIFDNFQFIIQDGNTFDNTKQLYADVRDKPANINALTGSEAIQNSQITITNGQLSGIGTGNNTAVANSLISVDNDGNLINIGNISPVSVGNNVNGLIRNPGGGTFRTTTSTLTGALRITLPVFFTDTMLKFTVDIFEYNAGLSCKLSIAGFNYSGQVWYNVTASVIGGNTEYPVYFGHNGSKCVIWIGDTTETWTYPQVQITEAMFSYANYTKGMWESGWAIDFSSAARTNVSASVLDTYPGADWTKNTKRPSNLAALAGTELIKNSDITINASGQITNIGTAGVVVDNSKVTLSALGYTGSLQATKNSVTQSASNPSGGSAGDLHYNTSTKRWWTNIGGTWTDNQIEAVSVTAAWVTTLTLNASQINAGTFTSHTIDTSGYGRFRGGISVDGYQAAIIANDQATQYTGLYSKGSTHGMIGSSSATYGAGVYGINTGVGTGVIGFSTSGVGGSFSSVNNHGVLGGSTSGYGGSFSSTNSRGVNATSTNNHAIYGVTSGADYAGVAGEGTSGNGVYGSATSGFGVHGVSSSGTGVRADSSSGPALHASTSSTGVYGGTITGINYGLYVSGATYALYCDGKFAITSTDLVTNLNANYLNGVTKDGFLRYIYTDYFEANVSGGYLHLNCTISGYRFAHGSGNQVLLEPVSDSRLKEDIWPEIFGKDFIKKLSPISYRYKNRNKIRHHGFIANNMVEFTGDFNDSLSLYDPQRDIYGTDYMSYISPIVKAMQEDFSELDQTKKELANVKQELEELKTLVQQLLNNQN